MALVSRCAALGLVEKQPCRADRRVVQAHLTAKGREVVERVAALHSDELPGGPAALVTPGPWSGR